MTTLLKYEKWLHELDMLIALEFGKFRNMLITITYGHLER